MLKKRDFSFIIIMGSKHLDLVFKKIFLSLKTVLYLLSFEAFNVVCIVLIWFLLTFLQESGNIDAISKVKRKEKNSKLVF